jgi:hypothetical protein
MTRVIVDMARINQKVNFRAMIPSGYSPEVTLSTARLSPFFSLNHLDRAGV